MLVTRTFTPMPNKERAAEDETARLLIRINTRIKERTANRASRPSRRPDQSRTSGAYR